MTRLHAVYPGKIPSAANLREHHMARAKRVKHQRFEAFVAMRQAKPWPLDLVMPVDITLTRIAPRPIVDDDNLPHAFKAVRDGVADWLSIDDGSPMLRWHYAQRKGLPKEQAVEILLVDAA